MMFFRLLSLVGSVVVLLGSSSRADVNEARKHYERGTALYDLQRYSEAAKEYEVAFEQKPDPALLFNIGQAYRLAHQYANAVGAFRSYLRRVPEAQNRAEVEARIVELQRLLDDEKRAKEAARPPEPAASPPATPSIAAHEVASAGDVGTSGRTLKISGAVAFAGGIVGLALGGGMAALANNAARELNHPASGKFDAGAEDRRNTYQAAGVVCLGVGGAALVAGAIIYATGWRRSHRFLVSAEPSRSGGVAVVMGAF